MHRSAGRRPPKAERVDDSRARLFKWIIGSCPAGLLVLASMRLDAGSVGYQRRVGKCDPSRRDVERDPGIPFQISQGNLDAGNLNSRFWLYRFCIFSPAGFRQVCR